MIVGDVNTCGSWYPQRAESTGIELEEYLESAERIILNQDNVQTRTNSSSGSQNGIDIAAIHSNWLPYATWETAPEPFSDHHACLVTLNVGKHAGSKTGRKMELKNCRLGKFGEEIENALKSNPVQEDWSIEEENHCLTVAIIKAAA